MRGGAGDCILEQTCWRHSGPIHLGRRTAEGGCPHMGCGGLEAMRFLHNFLQAFLLAVGAVLRGADEHLHEVVVEGVVELALETPFELRVVEVAGMQIEIICVDGERGLFELNDDLDAFALGARGEIQQGMFVEKQLRLHAVQAGMGGFGHRGILLESGRSDHGVRPRGPGIDMFRLSTGTLYNQIEGQWL
jgi:hypothetical protein